MKIKNLLTVMTGLALFCLAGCASPQKEAVANTGILGSYEGTSLLEIPQRFKDNTLANKLVDPTILLVFPVIDYKPVKFIDGGETTLEVTETGANRNSQQTNSSNYERRNRNKTMSCYG